MINILIIDDTPEKSKKISEVIRKNSEVYEVDIKFAQDIITAKQNLRERKYDIVFLDIQIPNRVDQETKINGGIELLDEIFNNNRYILPQYIIGITAYDDCFDSHKERFLSIIKYEVDSYNWENDVKRCISYVLLSKRVSNRQDDLSFTYDLAIICALDDPELKAILNLPASWTSILDTNDNTIYYTTTFKAENREINVIAAAADQMGLTASAVLSMKMINRFRPHYLAMTGIAAGVRGEVNIGDILVADPSWDYGNGKIKIENEKSVFYPDPLQIRLNVDIKAKLKLLNNNTNLLKNIKYNYSLQRPDNDIKICIGAVGSGSAVLADKNVIDSIKEHARKIVGIDMETFAVMYAAEYCSKPRPIAFSLKSVCDFADSNKNDSYQQYSSYLSAQILYYLATTQLEY